MCLKQELVQEGQGQGSEIYIKPKKTAALVGVQQVLVSDVADVYAAGVDKAQVEQVVLFTTAEREGSFLLSVLDVVAAVSAALPGCSVINLGEMDTAVNIKAHPPKKRSWLRWLKVGLVSLVLFVGASTAIMTFHTDSQLGTVFRKYYEMFYGREVEKPYIINIPYSIGLALGIVVFFNHFAGKRLTNEPTPIEVEMATYESDVEDAVISRLTLAKEKQKSKESDKSDKNDKSEKSKGDGV